MQLYIHDNILGFSAISFICTSEDCIMWDVREGRIAPLKDCSLKVANETIRAEGVLLRTVALGAKCQTEQAQIHNFTSSSPSFAFLDPARKHAREPHRNLQSSTVATKSC